MENVNQDLAQELYDKVNVWVDRSFNFIQLPVVEKYCQSSNEELMDKIRQLNPHDAIEDWLLEVNHIIKLNEFIEHSKDDFDISENDFIEYIEDKPFYNLKSSLMEVYGENIWDLFKDWCYDYYYDDIHDYITSMDNDNHPVWNTLFEFRDSFRNNEEDIERFMKLGFGVITDLDDFNVILFMTSAGHSFYSAYWIPLYLELFPDENEKYKGVDFQCY